MSDELELALNRCIVSLYDAIDWATKNLQADAAEVSGYIQGLTQAITILQGYKGESDTGPVPAVE